MYSINLNLHTQYACHVTFLSFFIFFSHLKSISRPPFGVDNKKLNLRHSWDMPPAPPLLSKSLGLCQHQVSGILLKLWVCSSLCWYSHHSSSTVPFRSSGSASLPLDALGPCRGWNDSGIQVPWRLLPKGTQEDPQILVPFTSSLSLFGLQGPLFSLLSLFSGTANKISSMN